MNTTRLVTYWNAGEAHDVIEFLRDQLWETYGNKIIAMRLETEEQHAEQADQIQLMYD